jgi:GTP pyrophosphokinase
VELARHAWEVDSPEADRIGDHRLRSRLEDAALRILEPAEFRNLQRTLATMIVNRQQWLADRESEIRTVLSCQQVQCLAIERRVKHVAGLWRKIRAKDLSVEQVQDVFAFRIIVANTADCYRALRAVHRHFEPQLLRFKDYVACPKANGYQSLHTSVRCAMGPVFEIQIRSQRMHWQANQGEAAHWQYKKKQGVSPEAKKSFGAAWRRLGSALLHRIKCRGVGRARPKSATTGLNEPGHSAGDGPRSLAAKGGP